MEDKEILDAKGRPFSEYAIGRLELAEIPREDWQYMEVYKNGAIADSRRKAGRIIANPGGGEAAITSDNYNDMRSRFLERRIDAQLAAGRAITSIAIDSENEPSLALGWQKIVRAQADLAQNTDKGRASTEAARFVGQAAGIFGGRDSDNSQTDGNVTVNIPVRAVLYAFQALRDQEGVVVDVSSSDVEGSV